MLTRNQSRIARQLRRSIGKHSALISTGCTDAEYWRARNESDCAVSMARYLGQHLQGLDVPAWKAATGVHA